MTVDLKPSVLHGTFVLEKHYPHPPAKVFAAFVEKAKKRRWFVEGEGFTIERYDADFRVGGKEAAAFRYQGGPLITMEAVYHDIVPRERLVFAYVMDMEGKRMSVSLTTIELTAMPDGGTELKFTEQGAFLDGVDSLKGREEGSRGLLESLGKELDAHP
jgi:uncharacterized protein YndB with AHSA1/START domain